MTEYAYVLFTSAVVGATFFYLIHKDPRRTAFCAFVATFLLLTFAYR